MGKETLDMGMAICTSLAEFLQIQNISSPIKANKHYIWTNHRNEIGEVKLYNLNKKPTWQTAGMCFDKAMVSN